MVECAIANCVCVKIVFFSFSKLKYRKKKISCRFVSSAVCAHFCSQTRDKIENDTRTKKKEGIMHKHISLLKAYTQAIYSEHIYFTYIKQSSKLCLTKKKKEMRAIERKWQHFAIE